MGSDVPVLVHHIVTNDPVHDPDIQHLPFFAVSNRFFNNIYSTYYNRTLEFDAAAKVFVALQHHLYYIVLSFGRFNLYRLSWTHVLMHSAVPFRALELAGLVGFWFWFGTLLSRLDSWFTVAVYMIVSHCLTGLLHVQITLSHFGMDTSDVPGEDFATKALRTTMDVDCPEWLDWFHGMQKRRSMDSVRFSNRTLLCLVCTAGGLQFQVAHHLFPRVPRHNLRKLRPLVAQFAKDHDLVYTSYHFVDGNKYVIGILKDVADQVKFIGNVIASESNQMAGEKRA